MVVEAVGRLGHRQLFVEHACAQRPEHLARLGLRPTAPNMPVLAPITSAGLPRIGFSAIGRETQSSAFFSAPGIEWLYSGVAIRTASAPAIASFSATTAGGGIVFGVGVVGRDVAERPELLELGSGWLQLGRHPEEPGVVGVAAKAPADPEDLHYASAFTSSSATTSVTSLPSTRPPFGSGAFQFRPNSRRSRVASSWSPIRSPPAMSASTWT